MRSKKGFTLIELLVVIAIIALLLSIIMPGLRKAKEAAKALRCKANVRQMALAFSMYAVENDEKSFLFDYGEHYWFREIAPFLGSGDFQNDPDAYDGKLEINICPSTKIAKSGKGRHDKTWGFSGVYGSYGVNGWVLNPDVPGRDKTWFEHWGGSAANAKGKYFGSNYASIRGDAPVLADSFWVDAWPFSEDTMPDFKEELLTPSYLEHRKGFFMRRFTVNRHNEAISVGFIDGHAEKVKLVDLWTLRWNNDFASRSDITLPTK